MVRDTVWSVDYAEANNGGGANDEAKSMTGLRGGLGAQRSGGFIVDSLTGEEVMVEVDIDVDVDRGGTGDLSVLENGFVILELLEPLEPEVDLLAMATGANVLAPARAVAAAFDAEEEGPEASERLTAAMALIVAAEV